jgi:site-specific recombinase XerD
MDLRLEDLNVAHHVATVRGGKADRDRVVYLTPALADALQRYLAVRPHLPRQDHVFLLHNRPPNSHTIQNRLAAYGRQVGITVTPHQLRHTLATRLINEGMPLASLRKLLGHQNLNTTQIYAQLYDETLYQQFQAAMASLEAIAVEDWPHFDMAPSPVVTLGGSY